MYTVDSLTHQKPDECDKITVQFSNANAIPLFRQDANPKPVSEMQRQSFF